MKRIVSIGLAAALTQAAPAWAAKSASSLLGTWALDLMHSEIPPALRQGPLDSLDGRLRAAECCRHS